MKPPFTIVKQGDALLKWGTHANGIHWLVKECKVCHKSVTVLGSEKRRARNRKISKPFLREIVGYSVVSYNRQQLNRRKRLYTVPTARTSLFSDMCATCYDDFRNYAETRAKRVGVSGPLPNSLDEAQSYYLGWRVVLVKRKLKRLTTKRGVL